VDNVNRVVVRAETRNKLRAGSPSVHDNPKAEAANNRSAKTSHLRPFLDRADVSASSLSVASAKLEKT